jgi:integrase-like protein
MRASHLRAHILPALGHLPMNQVNQRVVQEFVNSLYEKLSDKSAKNTWATLRSLLAAAEAEELLRRIPKPKLRKVVPRDQPRFSAHHMRAIVEAAPNPELRALLAVLAETGCLGR